MQKRLEFNLENVITFQISDESIDSHLTYGIENNCPVFNILENRNQVLFFPARSFYF